MGTSTWRISVDVKSGLLKFLNLHFWDHQYLGRRRSGPASKASVNIFHECVQTPKGFDNLEKGARRKHGRCKGCKLVYNEKGEAINKKTSYYCYACKQFCHPECMTSLHKKSFKSRDKAIIDVEKDDKRGSFNQFKS